MEATIATILACDCRAARCGIGGVGGAATATSLSVTTFDPSGA